MSLVLSEKAAARASFGILQSSTLSPTVMTVAPALSAIGAYASYIGSSKITYAERGLALQLAVLFEAGCVRRSPRPQG